MSRTVLALDDSRAYREYWDQRQLNQEEITFHDDELPRDDANYNSCVLGFMACGLAHFVPRVHAHFWGAR